MNGKALQFYCEMYLLRYILYCEMHLPQVNVTRLYGEKLARDPMAPSLGLPWLAREGASGPRANFSPYKQGLTDNFENIAYETISVDFSQQTHGTIYQPEQFSACKPAVTDHKVLENQCRTGVGKYTSANRGNVKHVGCCRS